MMSHAEVHLEVRRILTGTRLKSFMVTTNSWQHEHGEVVAEWAACIHEGSQPRFYFRARTPEKLLEQVQAGVDKSRDLFAEPLGALEGLTGPAPTVTP